MMSYMWTAASPDRSLSRRRYSRLFPTIKNREVPPRSRDYSLSEMEKSIPNGNLSARMFCRLRAQRSISTLIKNQGIGDLYRIYSVTKRDGIGFNLASIPTDFSDTSGEPFDQRYMIALFNRGYDLASHNYSWAKAPPGMELAAQAHN
jgi:hypothetical protein